MSGCSDKPEGVIMCYAQVGDFADVAGMEEQPELVDANDLLETEEGDVPDLDEDEVMDDAGSDVMDVDECEEGSDADGEVIDAEFEEIDESEESVDAVDEDTADDAAHDPANEDI